MPNVHRKDKRQISVWLTRDERKRLDQVVQKTGKGTITELIRHLINKELSGGASVEE